tara:strand:+ start:241 stop:720 length:480 start_codon:yes stop_codon:yes gene_type:complete
MNNVIELTVYSSPSHGWGQVTCQQLIELGLDLKISEYSYRDGSLVYLEEDCDLPLFVDAARAAGDEIEFYELELRSDDRLRSYDRYKPPAVKTCYIPRADSKPSLREVAAYLPSNYFVTECTDDQIIVKGVDNCGWTLDGYVIPRLGSGMIGVVREVAA